MNKPLPVLDDDAGLDLCDAARRAAHDEGKSLGEWLDALMEDRAGSLGVNAADLGAEDRLAAVARGLGDPERPSTFRNAERALADFEADRRQRHAGRTLAGREARSAAVEPAPHEAASPKAASATVTLTVEAEPLAEVAAEPAVAAAAQPQRLLVEAKLSTLFKALNRSAERPAPFAPEASAAPVSTEERSSPIAATPVAPAATRASPPDLLGATALSPVRTLDQAIAEIAERQAQLDRVTVPAAKGGAPARRRAAEAAPAVPSSDPFESLKSDIARMSQRIEVMHSDVTRRAAPVPASTSAFDEIRSMLDRIQPDQSIDALERRVEDLTSKIDRALESQVAPDAFEHLTQKIEDVHASLSDRLSSAAAPGVGTDSLETIVREIVVNAGSGRSAEPDATALESLMQKLADKLDAAHEPRLEPAMLAELQVQVGKLGERIDRSDAGLAAIVAVERSMGELFSQMEETREATISAAENAARTAARDTLRSALTEGVLPASHGLRDPAADHVAHDLAEMKGAREAADQRLNVILDALNVTLEKVIDRLAALEQGRVPSAPPAAEPARSHAAPPADIPALAPGAANPLNAAHRARPVAPSEPTVKPPVVAKSDRPASPPDEDADFLIEPGAPRSAPGPAKSPAVTVPAPVAGTAIAQPDPASFIAAARRAAQAAAKSANRDMAGSDDTRSGDEGALDGKTGLMARVSGLVSKRRRPLLLALAGIVLLMGAVQVARLSLRPADPAATVGQAEPTPPTVTANSIPAGDAPAGRGLQPLDKPAAVPAPAAPAPAVPAIPAPPPKPSADASAPPAIGARPLPTLAMGAAANLAATKAAAAASTFGLGLRSLAEDGNAAAQFEWGLRLADGRGVARDIKSAAGWFEKAANQGIAPAAYRLGSIYEKGLGVTRDPAVAIGWYEKAAQAGNMRAMHNLAVMSAEGASGKPDYVKAATWFTKAAKAGVRDSQFNLAILYARGLGVEQNLPQSYTWFAVAASQGDTDAATKRDEVAQRLDAKALAEARKAADTFQAAPTGTAANEVAPPPGGWDAVAPRAASASSSFVKPGNAHLSSM